MNKNDVLELEIIDIGNNGEGIAKIEDKTIFIPFALKGELIKCHILKVNKNIAFGKIVEVLKASPIRVNPHCPYFMKCGGCNIQHIKYEEQLRIKTEIVKNALHKYSGIEEKVENCIGSNKQFEYRNKMQYPCTINGIGMFAQNSHRLVQIDYCPLSMPLCHKAYATFKDFCNETNQSLYDEVNHKGLIRNVLFREIDDKIAICIVINGNNINLISILIEKLKLEFGNDFSLYLNINTKKNNTILSNQTKTIFGQDELKATDFGIEYFISPNSFLQINRDVQNLIYSKVLELTNENDIVINGYSGAGLLSAIVAKKAKKVFGVEIVEEATINANKLMEHNNISNLENITEDCAIALPKLMNNVKSDNFSLILDPPRKGCESSILEAINSSLPNKIIYISCNPATLARDLKELKNNYSIKLIQPYDMFPQTKHIETLVYLEKKDKNE